MLHRYKRQLNLGHGFPFLAEGIVKETTVGELSRTRCLSETLHLSWRHRRRRRRWQDEYKGSFFSELGRELKPSNISSTASMERFFARFRL